MANWLRMALAVSALVAQAGFAAGPPGGFHGQRQGQGPAPNQFQQRDYGRQQMAPQRDQRADGRMSEEDRRNLHRDLDRANREIYKGR
jgi:hypothetical protein